MERSASGARPGRKPAHYKNVSRTTGDRKKKEAADFRGWEAAPGQFTCAFRLLLYYLIPTRPPALFAKPTKTVGKMPGGGQAGGKGKTMKAARNAWKETRVVHARDGAKPRPFCTRHFVPFFLLSCVAVICAKPTKTIGKTPTGGRAEEGTAAFSILKSI